MACPVGAPTPASSLPPQGASPRTIRDSLTIPEDRAEFTHEYKRALVTGAETTEEVGKRAERLRLSRPDRSGEGLSEVEHGSDQFVAF